MVRESQHPGTGVSLTARCAGIGWVHEDLPGEDRQHNGGVVAATSTVALIEPSDEDLAFAINALLWVSRKPGQSRRSLALLLKPFLAADLEVLGRVSCQRLNQG